MAVIIDAVKQFENGRIAVYSYRNADDPDDAGLVLFDLTELSAWRSFPNDARVATVERAAMRVLREMRASHAWPERISHIS